MKIVIDDAIPYIQGVLEPYAEVRYLPGSAFSAADVRDADALIIRTRTRCDAALLEGSRVRFIGSATIGFDHIDLDYCRTKGIRVETAQGCNVGGVAQYVFAALLQAHAHKTIVPAETTLGIVGVGHVGSKIKTVAEALGFRTLCCDPPRAEREAGFRSVGQERIAAESDIITLHLPLTREGKYATYERIGNSFFDRIDRPVVFFNTSRGEVVDDRALKQALDRSKISFCALDVWQHEPHIDPWLLGRADIATPHIAGYSRQGKANGTSMIVRAFARFAGIESLKAWYPEGVNPDIRWENPSFEALKEEMPNHYDITADSRNLKAHPESFETLRNRYAYREEFF